MTTSFTKSLWFLLLIAVTTTDATEKPVPCRSQWTQFSVGMKVPDDAIVLDDAEPTDTVHLVKAVVNGVPLIGTYDNFLESILLPVDVIYTNNTEQPPIEMLTNLHGCNVTWAGKNNFNGPNYWVESDKGNSIFVARAKIDGIFFGGQANLIEMTFSFGIENEDGNGTVLVVYEINKLSVQYLTLWSDGLGLELLQFEFMEDPFGGTPDFIGIDEIHNLGNYLVTQRVTHRKKVRQTTTITISETWTSTYTKTVTVNLLFYKKTKTETHTVSRTETTSVTTVDETDIAIEREIQVGPATRVQACSTITMKENFKTTYTALGRYIAKGFPVEELLAFLIADKVSGVWKEGDNVYVDVTGDMSGSLAMSSSFIVVPFDAVDGCSSLQKNIADKKRLRRLQWLSNFQDMNL